MGYKQAISANFLLTLDWWEIPLRLLQLHFTVAILKFTTILRILTSSLRSQQASEEK